MTKLDELNIEWIGICNLIQLLNVQRVEVYKRWYEEMQLRGHQFDPEEFPLQLETHPSPYFDLKGQPIDITRTNE
jgi:hypothetical protein